MAGYVYGSNAEKYKRVYVDNEQLREIYEIKVHKKRSERLLFYIAVFAILLGTVTIRYINLYNLTDILTKERDAYEDLLDTNAKLEFKLNSKIGADNISALAQRRLGMTKPSDSQKIYIWIKRDNLTLTAAELQDKERAGVVDAENAAQE